MATAAVRFVGLYLCLRSLDSRVDALDDEHIVGEPEVECGPERIGIRIYTDKPFHGTLYMQNRRNTEECRTANYSVDAARPNTFHSRLSIPLNDLATCGLELTRNRESGNLAVRGVWIFSFHPLFVTKVDRAFDVQCVFRQRDISSHFEMTVSNLVPLAIRRTFVLPFVEMKIVHGDVANPTLPPITKSKVGDPITFIWHAADASSVVNIYIKQCFAESKRGSSVMVIQDGCKQQSVMTSDVERTADGRILYATATTFKFPDDKDIWFRCRVLLCSKIQHSDYSTANKWCPEYEKCINGNRTKRSASDSLLADDLTENSYDMHIRVIDAYNQRASGTLQVDSDRVSLFDSDSEYPKSTSLPFTFCIKRWYLSWPILSSCALSAMIILRVIKRVMIIRRDCPYLSKCICSNHM
uniref:ZP domain-containing protein n=1 Tax=Trichuris muris TaxID=70415 RepID=A0A5S6QS08_TRIMR